MQRQVERLWLTHPLVGQIVNLLCDFAVGSGLTITAAEPAAQQTIDGCIASQPEWEGLQRGVAAHLAVYGEAMVCLESRDTAAWPLLRLIPPTSITQIERDRAGELVRLVEERYVGGKVERREHPADTVVWIRTQAGLPQDRGIPDLARIVPWVERYDQWLLDRLRINRTRGAFAFLRKVPGWGITPEPSLGQGPAESLIPRPGSVLVVNEQEEWQVLAPEVGADDASADGRALKLMILAGAGLAEHYVGDLSASNLATAQAAELPMLKRFEAHQRRVISLFRGVFERILAQAGVVGTLELTLPAPGLRDAQTLTTTLAQQLELGLISQRTARSLIPWIPDVGAEEARIAAETAVAKQEDE
ncbi:MAG: hypothetical protein GEEBNDBF_01400 [bacterium]|nr:hypothetical protein [bacterium]